MKKIYLILAFCNVFHLVFGQSDVEFNFNGNFKDCKINDVVIDKNDNFFTTGVYLSNVKKDSVGGFNINYENESLVRKTLYNSGGFVAKFTQKKELQWLINIENASSATHHLLTDDSSNVYFIGKIQGKIIFNEKNILNALTGDIFVAKYTSDGKLKWVKKYVGSSDDGTFKPKIDGEGNLYIIGKYQNSMEVEGRQVLKATGQNPEPYILKLDRNGNYIWAKSFNENLGLKAITVNSKSEVFIVGDFKESVPINGNILQSAGLQDIFYAKYDKNGQFLWVKTIAGKVEDVSHNIETDKLGNVYLAGLVSDNAKFDILNISTKTTNGKSIFLAKISGNDGKIDWIRNIVYSKDIDVSLFTTVQLLKLNADGEPYLFGVMNNSLNIDSQEIVKVNGLFRYIVKFDTKGAFVSATPEVDNSSSASTYITAMEIDSKRNIYVTGYTNYTRVGSSFGFLKTTIELNENSCNSKDVSIIKNYNIGGNLTLSDAILDNNAFNYQWYKNGIFIPNATQAIFQAKDAGYYTLKLINKTNASCQINSSNSIGIYPTFNPFPAYFSYFQNELISTAVGDRIEWYRNNVKITELNGNKYAMPTDGIYQVKTYTDNTVQVSQEINIEQGRAILINKGVYYDDQDFCKPVPYLKPIWQNTNLLINAPNNKFQWFLNGQSVKDSTNAHFKPITMGDYQVSVFVPSENKTYTSGKYKIIIEDFPKSLSINKLEDNCGANALLKVDDSFMQRFDFQGVVWRLDGKDIPNENYPYLTVNKGGYYTFSVKYIDRSTNTTCNYNSFITFDKKTDFKLNVAYAYAGSGCVVDSFKVFVPYDKNYTYGWTKNDVPIKNQTVNELFVPDKSRYKGIVRRADGCVNETVEISLKGCSSAISDKFIILNPPLITADKVSIYTNEKSLLSSNNCSNVNLQWLKDTKPIVGANKSNLEVKESGNYALQIEKFGCVATTNAMKITVENVLAIGEELPEIDIEVYPNPTEDNLIISTSSQINSPITVKMINILGKLIKNYDFLQAPSQIIDVRILPEGMYFLVFEVNGKRIVKKIIKKD